MPNHVRLIAAAVALAIAAPALAAAPTSIVVFGDSLVDAGNAYIGTGGQTAQPELGYFNGRFTNGPEYTDLLNQRLFGTLTTPYLAGGSNFAVGGARAADDRPLQGFTVPGLQSQFGLFLTSGLQVDPGALYVINFGNNDVSAILADPASTAARTAAYVGNIVAATQYLSLHGATKVLIVGVPDYRQAAGVALQAALDSALDSIVLAPQTDLFRFDILNYFKRVQMNPALAGLPANTDFVNACIPQQLAFGFPPDCTGFFSFDGIHPTAPVHVALANKIGFLIGLGAVPEPAVWLQMIAGFGMIGTVVRRRRTVAA